MFLAIDVRFCIFLLCTIKLSQQIIFLRTIEAVGFPYYKILLSLGGCKETILYYERKIWPTLRMNRVLDLYYKSEKPDFKVSRVEIRLVLNDTACQAYSKGGVGSQEFKGTLFLPTNMAAVFSTFTIFTCSRGKRYNNTNLGDLAYFPYDSMNLTDYSNPTTSYEDF